MKPAPDRPTFVLTLRAEPHVAEPVIALRRALKFLLRNCGFRCVSIEKEPVP